MKRVVLGESEAHGGYAVGPVFLDEAVEELRDLIEGRGDICRGVVNLLPAGEFKAETRRRIAAAPAPVVADAGWDEEANAELGAHLAELAEEGAAESEPETMTVRVPDRRHSPVGHATIRTVTIAATCPRCGKKRGKPQEHRFFDGDTWQSCDRWENPCWHLDVYEAVLAEAEVSA